MQYSAAKVRIIFNSTKIFCRFFNFGKKKARKKLSFSQEIEGFADFFVRGGLVESDVADVGQEGETDGVADVFLVVLHQADEFGIVVASDGWTAVVFADELHGLAQSLGRKTAFHNAQIEFANEAVGDGITVKQG